MSDADFHKDRSSSQLLGKEFIIVVVVIFSALSFTLGYFVGKSGDRREDRKSFACAGDCPDASKAGTGGTPSAAGHDRSRKAPR